MMLPTHVIAYNSANSKLSQTNISLYGTAQSTPLSAVSQLLSLMLSLLCYRCCMNLMQLACICRQPFLSISCCLLRLLAMPCLKLCCLLYQNLSVRITQASHL